MPTLRRSFALVCSTVAITAGCSLIVAPDDDGSGGGDGGTANSGGGCTSPSDCVTANACEEPTCDAGLCGTTNLPDGTPVATQTPGDCQETQCDGNGNAVDVSDDTDLPDDMADCTDDVCTAGVPSNPNKLGDTPCGAALALFCDGTGQCVDCTDAAPCGAGDDCKTATCTAGVCGFDFTAAGALPSGLQVTGDCQTAGCG